MLHIQRANYERFAYFKCIRQHETKSRLVFYWNNWSSYKIKLKQREMKSIHLGWVYSMLESDSEIQTRTSRELNLITKWRHRTTNRAPNWFTIERFPTCGFPLSDVTMSRQIFATSFGKALLKNYKQNSLRGSYLWPTNKWHRGLA